MDTVDRVAFVERLASAAEFLNRQFYSVRMGATDESVVSVAQVNVLMLLEHRGPMKMTDVGLVLMRTISTVSPMMDRLEEKGLIVKRPHPNDRRALLCELTPAWQDAINEFWHLSRERMSMVADQMTDEQLEAAVVSIETVLAAEVQVEQARADMEHPSTP